MVPVVHDNAHVGAVTDGVRSCALLRTMSWRIIVMSSSLEPPLLSIITEGRMVTGGTMMSVRIRFSGRPEDSFSQIRGRSSAGIRLKRSRTTWAVRSSYGSRDGSVPTAALSM